MESALFLIALLVCPLGMAAMGGIAWVSARAFGQHSNHGPADPVDDPGR